MTRYCMTTSDSDDIPHQASSVLRPCGAQSSAPVRIFPARNDGDTAPKIWRRLWRIQEEEDADLQRAQEVEDRLLVARRELRERFDHAVGFGGARAPARG